MRRRVLAGLAAAMVGGPACAAPAWTACRVEHGVLVVPARAAGLTGAFILDTAAPRSLLDATQASLAGIDGEVASAPVDLAGHRLAKVEMAVAALDARTRSQPTPITGVLGADVLAGLVLEVRPGPCRFRLTTRAAPVRPLASLPVELRGGAPYVQAGVSDGARAELGRFRVATGSPAAVRLNDGLARIEGASKAVSAPLRALSVGEVLVENPAAEVAPEADPGVAGEIGEPVWAAHGFQLDLRRQRLVLFDPAQQKTRRKRSGGS